MTDRPAQSPVPPAIDASIAEAVWSCSSDGILVFLRDDRSLLAMNPAAELLFGCKSEEMDGQPIWTLITLDDDPHAPGAEDDIDRIFEGDIVVREGVGRPAGGAPFPVEVIIRPVGRSDGLCFFAFCRDISDRRLAIESLAQAEEKYKGIVDNINLGVYQATLDGHFLSVNPALARIYGYSTSQVFLDQQSRAANRIFEPADAERFFQLLRRDLVVVNFECQTQRPDGGVVWTRHEAKAFADANGEFDYYQGMVEDITERKLAEQQLLEATRATEEANAHMRRDLELAARVQHALLPTSLPKIPGASFAWLYRPCAALAGDSLNIFQLDDRHVGMYVLDVSGHGVPAALLSVALSRALNPVSDQNTILKRIVDDDVPPCIVSPREVARQLNALFPMDPVTEQYFTFAYGILNTRYRQFRFVTCGHPGPIHIPANGEPRVCQQPGFPIGWVDDADYEETILDLEIGDRIFFYSDGIPEAANYADKQFGIDRLQSLLDQHRREPVAATVDRLLDAILAWNDKPADDLSVLAMSIDGIRAPLLPIREEE